MLGMLNPFFCGATETKQGKPMTEKIHDVEVKGGDGLTFPMPSLATTGEKINVLIRIKKAMPYTAALVFVERQDWPEKRQKKLRELVNGIGRDADFPFGDPVPYPIKLRFQIDSVDAPMPLHEDLVVAERSSTYGTYYPVRYPKLSNGQHSVIWRANGLWGIRNLEPGVYRIRIENLNPASEVDFETLLQLFNNSRKA